MYQVLYRKWRPKTFSQVVGQEYVTTALKNEVDAARLSHAYLFVGSRGTGKTSCAKILAKAVNCLHPVNGDPCGECEVCKGIEDGSILDVTELDAASNNGVDYVRELREEVAYMPAVAKYRVYIIDEVHMMTDSAFNALLKTLEEPPAHVIFILATTEVQELPDTILSRCQRFDFGRIAPEKIAARIAHIAENEPFSVDEDAALMLARLADGGMRDALSLLDQCVSRADRVTMQVVTETAGLAGRDPMYTLSSAVLSGDGGAVLEWVDALHNASKDMERLCVECLDFYRQLMLCRQVKDPSAMIVLPPDEMTRLKAEAERYTLPTLMHCLDVLQTALERLRGGSNRRVEVEMALLKLCEPALDTSTAALVRRLSAVEAALQNGGAPLACATVPAPQPVAVETPAEPVAEQPAAVTEEPAAEENPVPAQPAQEVAQPTAPAAQLTADGDTPFDKWEDVLSELSQTAPPLHGVLIGSTAAIRDDFVLISTENAMFRTLVSGDGNKKKLSDAIEKVTGRTYRIGMKKAAAKEAPPSEPDSPLSAFLRESRDAGIAVDIKEES